MYAWRHIKQTALRVDSEGEVLSDTVSFPLILTEMELYMEKYM